ncbi:MAG: PstS family phosphate ABC transporter substrate-binding protein [Phycisphaerae bacterium]|nr:PstS family phosphate ABC transporter substrate-binding protein [Phycisphaerae bacterium]
MRTLTKGIVAGLLLGAMVAPAVAQDRIVKVDGSSTVAPISEAAAESFQQKNKGTKVTVGTSGTGGGFKKFVRGETDISNASRPISKSEMEDAKKNGIEYIELPIAFDALTVVVHKDNTWATSMTVDELKMLWEPGAQGKITKWNQIRKDWPDAEIKLFGAGTDSGTFDYFTEAVVGKAKSSRGDYTASEDDHVLVRGVEGNKNSLGYFGMAYFIPHKDKMKAVKIDWIKDGKSVTGGPIEPSEANVIAGKYSPLSRPLFIYVNRKSAETKPDVRAFVDYYVANASKLAAEVKYVPLPSETYSLVKARWGKMVKGTVFHGESAVGLRLDDVMKKEEGGK